MHPLLSEFGLSIAAIASREGWWKSQPLDQPCHDWPIAALQDALTSTYGRIFIGSIGSEMPCVYLTPKIPVPQLVREFAVGAHGAASYGYDREESIDLVVRRITDVEKIAPLIVTYIDEAGFRARFAAPIDKARAKKIEALFDSEDFTREGLEPYTSEWNGNSPLEIWSQLLKEQMITLWWD